MFLNETRLTCGSWVVDGFVCLDEDVPCLEGGQHHLLQCPAGETCLQVDVLLLSVVHMDVALLGDLGSGVRAQ